MNLKLNIFSSITEIFKSPAKKKIPSSPFLFKINQYLQSLEKWNLGEKWNFTVRLYEWNWRTEINRKLDVFLALHIVPDETIYPIKKVG